MMPKRSEQDNSTRTDTDTQTHTQTHTHNPDRSGKKEEKYDFLFCFETSSLHSITGACASLNIKLTLNRNLEFP